MARTATKPAPLPRDHLIWSDDLGLRTVTYLNESVQTDANRRAWLPRDLIAMDGSACIIHRPADREYSFDGWQPEHSGMFGGRYRTIQGALAWLERAQAVRAGTANNFLGV